MSIFAIAAVAVSALAGAASSKKQRKGVKAQNQATRLKNLKARQDFLKDVRQARAAAIVQAAASGGGGVDSSALRGVLTSIQAQEADTTDFIQRQIDLNAEANRNFVRASRLATLSGLAATAAQAREDFSTFQQTKPPDTTQGSKEKVNVSLFKN